MAPAGNAKAEKVPRGLPRDEVFGASALPRATLDRRVAGGQIRRLARGLYTSNIDDPADEVIRRNTLPIAGVLFPGSVVSDRSAIEGGTTGENELLLVADRDANVTVGNTSYRARRGPGPVEGDMPWMGVPLYFASPARALLENARLTRGRGGRRSRGLNRDELEEYLERKLDALGAAGLNRLRDQARAIAPQLGLEEEQLLVDRLVGAILGTRELDARSPLLRARQSGLAYDDQRMEIFRILRDALLKVEHAPVVASPTDPRERHLPFFEAYFSNYIEGTIFTLDEAIQIVYAHEIPIARPQDAHDILGTFAIVSSVTQMTRLPVDADDFLELLHSRHAQMMERRPEIRPGEFKDKPNQAGATGTVFVHPDRVQGTLVKGFELYRELADPFARATYMMFLVSEVHPFADGNGRIARIMMNAELVAANQERIVVTPSMREGYIGSLRDLSAYGNPDTLIRVLDAYQAWTHAIDFGDLTRAREQLEARDAMDATETTGGGLAAFLDSGGPAAADG
jgi:hypothetical protein